MCGLFGIFSAFPCVDKEFHHRSLAAAQDALSYRGPDNRGLMSFNILNDTNSSASKLVLGHTRLSIIDLSPDGLQPMQTKDGRFTIVFNGEIYNYREVRALLRKLGYMFYTDTDTEVLLNAWAQWGINGLRSLTGMFAFAVYDCRDESLTLVRDAFGIKPLYYQKDASGIRFASEIRALSFLSESKDEVNYQRAYDYLVFGHYDDSGDSFVRDICHLRPGQWMRIDLKPHQVHEPLQWWSPVIDERVDLSFDEAAAHLRKLFLNSVRLHMRSDVPIGAALSGGIDSSALVCAMRYLEPDLPIHTFSYVARGFDVGEERWIDIVNAHVGGIAHKVLVEPHELINDLDDMIHAQGEPFCGTSVYASYRVFRAAREAGVKVILDGQGADELLAGYSGYPSSRVRSLLENGQIFSIPLFLYNWAKWPGRGKKRAIQALGSVLVPQVLRKRFRPITGHSRTPCWVDADFLKKHGVKLRRPATDSQGDDSAGRRVAERLRYQLTGHGLSALLRHADRNSMRWSIESRVPFLTTEIAEFLLRLPESYLISQQGETKSIFREAMRGIVPDEVLDRKDKIGFRTPEEDWLRHADSLVFGWLGSTETSPPLRSRHCGVHLKKVLGGQKPLGSSAWRVWNYLRWKTLIDRNDFKW